MTINADTLFLLYTQQHLETVEQISHWNDIISVTIAFDEWNAPQLAGARAGYRLSQYKTSEYAKTLKRVVCSGEGGDGWMNHGTR